MIIEGIRNPEALRDYLYTQMRGATGEKEERVTEGRPETTQEEALSLLKEIRDHLQALSAKGKGRETA